MTADRTWRAIVAFNETDDVSEDWSWFYSDVREACDGTDVFVVYAGPGVQEVEIAPNDETVTRVSIAEFRSEPRGYLFMESGRETRFQEYDQSQILLRQASDYFGTDLTA